MGNKPLSSTLSVTIVLLILCSSLFGQNDSEISEREYGIYNFFVKSFSSSSNIIVKDSTKNKDYFPISSDEFAHPIDDDFIFEFRKMNSTTFKIDKKELHAPKNLKTETKECYFEFSRCLIKNDTLAMVYVGIQYSSFNGEGNIYILRRKSVTDNWYVDEKILRWRS